VDAPGLSEPDELFSNGIDASDGGYLLPPLAAEEVAKLAMGEPWEPRRLELLRRRDFEATEAAFAARNRTRANDLGYTGWGLIVGPRGLDPEVRKALDPLIELRRGQAKTRYRECCGEHAYRPGLSAIDYAGELGAGPGAVDPAKVPYYLLIVGGPDEVPYRVQCELDAQFAVGRVHFETPAEYLQYALAVVDAESAAARPPQDLRAEFVATRNPHDHSTQQCADHLVGPLARMIEGAQGTDARVGLTLGEAATKATVCPLLTTAVPDVLFWGSHGLGYRELNPDQECYQGSLVCQDWPGPLKWKGPIPADFRVSADDITGDARVSGLIAFFFACYSAGTPRHDDFAHRTSGLSGEQAVAPFVARLPRRLLAHPEGGALAVIGHVDHAWSHSFTYGEAGPDIGHFEDALMMILLGDRLGNALEVFGDRYAHLAVALASVLARIYQGYQADQKDLVALARLWTAHNDARNYVVLGDPAVRLKVAEP
jgi:hypothetical protein